MSFCCINRASRFVLFLVILLGWPSSRAIAEEAQANPAIRERMQQFVAEGEASGIVTLVADRERVLHLDAVGLAELETQRAMTTDTLFAVASMTKPIVATAVMILQEENKLSLDDPVSKYLPENAELRLKSGEPARNVMTIRHLLTHTSGLGGDQKNEGTLAETAAALAQRPLDFEPGTKWQYSPGLNVAGRIVEVIAQQPLEEFLAERIFKPLQMNDTSFLPNEEQQARLAKLYEPGRETGTLQAAAPHWITDVSPDRKPNPSGGLFSTATDMAHYYQMLLRGGEWNGQRIVSEESVREMTRVQTGDLTTGFTPGAAWGLGFCLIQKPEGVTEMLSPGSFGHGGAFGTQGWVDPQNELIFVLLIQRTKFGNSDASELRREFQQLAVEMEK